MIDFSEIPDKQVMARGQYSIVRSKREQALKDLRALCESQSGAVAAVLRDIQEGRDVERHLSFLRDGFGLMAENVAEVTEMQIQLDLIKPIAFPE